ncbi:PIN domain-containing protein [Sphingobacterium sp. UME9]|uniref:PIN domain-containing protein n=1 Tax=Sphingobacterium sp. UME9 TaxID=1862316 RepID=UPI0016043743|nr:PIN domain-containing protein [Sphingobacterium sp. UME9]MBB1643890.1 hypothetical protein [Sphingobacterium sp. UME9]
MLIFIDTNIFFRNWKLKNADFSFLFNFITNENGVLLLSELVVSEIESIRNRELEASKLQLEKCIKSIDSMCESPLKIDISAITKSYSFKDILAQKLDPEFIRYIDYSSISQEVVVRRAMDRVRPFKEGEKGYRDTLIWLSLLNYLSVNEIKENVAFISNNSDDFLNSRKTDFHADLIKDIEAIKLNCSIIPYSSLFNFIDKNVDKNEHLIAHSELDEIEDLIEEYTIDYLNNWSTEELKISLHSSYPQISSLLSIDDHEFIIDEGMEDGTIESKEHIKGRIVYVSYNYNLRICTLKITISREEYNRVQYTLPIWHNVEELGEDYSQIEIYCRIYLSSSFEYDMENKTIDGFSVNRIGYR